MRQFDLEAALRGEPLITRSGHQVIGFCQVAPSTAIKHPFVAYVVGKREVYTYTETGTWSEYENTNTPDDLFMAPKQKKKLWLAIGKKDIDKIHTTSNAFPSKELLLEYYDPDEYDQIIEIEIEDE